MPLHLFFLALPISAVILLGYPILRRKTLPLQKALRQGLVASVILVLANHLYFLGMYIRAYSQGALFGAVLPIPLVAAGIALLFGLSCLMLVGICGCCRAILRKLLVQE